MKTSFLIPPNLLQLISHSNFHNKTSINAIHVATCCFTIVATSPPGKEYFCVC